MSSSHSFVLNKLQNKAQMNPNRKYQDLTELKYLEMNLEKSLFPMGKNGAILALVFQLGTFEVRATEVPPHLSHNLWSHNQMDTFVHDTIPYLPSLTNCRFYRSLAPLSSLKPNHRGGGEEGVSKQN